MAMGGGIDSFGSERKKKKTNSRVIGANDTIRLAVIGVNSRGKALAKNFSKMPLCEETHLYDCDSKALESC